MCSMKRGIVEGLDTTKKEKMMPPSPRDQGEHPSRFLKNASYIPRPTKFMDDSLLQLLS